MQQPNLAAVDEGVLNQLAELKLAVEALTERLDELENPTHL
jgi:hypothetical protein